MSNRYDDEVSAEAVEIQQKLASAGATKSFTRCLMRMWLRGYADQYESLACNSIFVMSRAKQTNVEYSATLAASKKVEYVIECMLDIDGGHNTLVPA